MGVRKGGTREGGVCHMYVLYVCMSRKDHSVLLYTIIEKKGISSGSKGRQKPVPGNIMSFTEYCTVHICMYVLYVWVCFPISTPPVL